MRRIFVLLALLTGGAASAQSPELSTALATGQVGERFDGYLGFKTQPGDALRRQVAAINIQRRSLYKELAQQRGVTVQLVGITTGCTLLKELPVGGLYMLKDGTWRRRAPADAPPQPDYCR